MTVTTEGAVDATADTRGHSFRRRLLDGLGESIDERGYRETTIADIVRHARTSKRTFYQEFGSKEECFVELLWTANQEMIADIRAAVDPEAFWQNQIRQAIDAYVDSMEARPAVMLSWIRDLPALGTAMRSMQRRGVEELIDMLVDLSASPGFRRAKVPRLSRPVAVILIGGLRELTALTVEDNKDLRGIVESAAAAAVALVGSVTRAQ